MSKDTFTYLGDTKWFATRGVEFNVGDFDYNVRIDFRPLINAIRDKEKAIKKSTQDGLVRRAIYTDVYRQVLKPNFKRGDDFLPVLAGTLRDSPMGLGQKIPTTFKKSTLKTTGITRHEGYGKTYKRVNGKIDKDGILFDPYVVSSRGEFHYASLVPTFRPAWVLKQNMDVVTEIVKKRILEEVQ